MKFFHFPFEYALNINIKEILALSRALLFEQFPLSPHIYILEGFFLMLDKQNMKLHRNIFFLKVLLGIVIP